MGALSFALSALKTAQEAAQNAGEAVPVFIERAVATQAQRDKMLQGMRQTQAKSEKEG